jgi:gliding motility-associated-like protein
MNRHNLYIVGESFQQKAINTNDCPSNKKFNFLRIAITLILTTFLLKTYSQIAFVENKGQWDKRAMFRLNLPNGAMFPETDGISYSFYKADNLDHSLAHHNYKHINPVTNIQMHAYKMSFVNANISTPTASEQCSDYENYFIGNNPSKWGVKALRYKKLLWKNIYHQIDYTLYVNNDNSLQYDFVINPGGTAEDIKLKYEGQDTLFVDKEGKVVLITSVNRANELNPYAYQIIDNQKIQVKCTFLIRNNYLAFQFPDGYNESYPLIIDPVLVFCSYSGSTTDNWGFTATFDDYGNGYSGGIVFNVGYPTTLGAFQVNYGGGEPYDPNNPNYYGVGCDIGIIKYSADGLQRLWATYLGGTTSEELPHSLVCNRSNDLIIMGTTGSSDFPTTVNAFDRTFNGGDTVVYDNVIRFSHGTDIFVTRLSEDGSQLLASTYIGGSKNDGLNFRDFYVNFMMEGNSNYLYYNYADGARGEVICDGAGNVYVGTCTFSSDFPVTPGVFNPVYSGNQEGVVFKLNPNFSQLLWSSFFGGSDDDAVYSLDIDANNDVYIGGGTLSANIPTTGGVYQPLNPGLGKANGFVAHISSTGSTLLASTYLGSSAYDQVYFVRVDKQKNVYVTGQTEAIGNTFIINAAYGNPSSGQFITKFPNNLSTPIWSTAFGTGLGKPNISLTAFSVDYCNRVYVSGWGREWAGDWATIHGTKNMDITTNAYQTQTDGQDFYLMVLADDASHLEYATYFGEIHPNGSSGYCGHDHVDGGTSRFDKRGNIYQSACASCGYGCNGFPTYPNPGVWSPNNGGYNQTSNWVCNNALFKFSFALPLTVADFQAPSVCVNTPVQFTNTSQLATQYSWNFGDGQTSTNANPTHTYTAPGTYNVTLIANNATSCNLADTIVRPLLVEQLVSQTSDTMICLGNQVPITVSASGTSSALTYIWSTTHAIHDTLNSPLTNPTMNVSPSQSQYYYVQVSSGVCTVIDSVHINVNSIHVQTSPDTTVCQNNQGVLHVTPINTPGNITYQWNPVMYIVSGANTASPIVQPVQNTIYYVTATESHGCTTIDSVTVGIDVFTAQFSSIQPVLCHNECTGMIQVSLNNPFLPVTFLWSNGDTSSQINNLCVGSYFVTVTDGIGCTSTLNTGFSNPPLLDGTIQVLSPATCDQYHPNTGSVQANGSGGTPGYHYHWNTNDTIPYLQNLFAGNYSVTITDNHGCDTVLSAVINDPSPLQILAVPQPTSCYGYCDGSSQVYITTQGVSPYTYLWNTGNVSTQINQLCSGVYSITVTDSDYCVRVQSVVVSQPDTIHPSIQIPGIKCYGDTTFAAITSVSGGTPTYTYLWNNGETGSSIHNLTEGNYWLEVTDAHGCKDTTTIILKQPDKLLADSLIIQSLCLASCNGRITVLPVGGTSPYSYQWSNGAHAASAANLCEGNFSVTVTDAHGCSYTNDYSVQQSDYHPPINAIAQPDVIYRGQSSDLYAQSSSNEHFAWSPNTGLTNPYIQNPVATPEQTTTYLVQITDAYGCTNIDTVVVTVLDVICSEPYIYVPNAFTPNGDGNNDILYVHADMAVELYFAIYDRWGECMFQTTDASKGWDGKYKGKPLDPAVFVYYLKVTCLNRLQFEKKGNITLIR